MTAFLLLFSLLAPPQTERQAGIWRLRAEAGVAEESIDAVASLLENARRFYEEDWSLGFPRSVPVLLHSSSLSFRRATGQRSYRAAVWDGSVMHVQNPRLLRARKQLASVILHEAAHVSLESRWGNALPGWFEEGFAVYNSGEIGGLPLPRRSLRSLAELGERRLRIPGEKAEREWYAEVGALMFVAIRQYGKESCKRLLARKLGNSFEHTVVEILRKPYAGFEQDLLDEYNYRVRKRRLPY